MRTNLTALLTNILCCALLSCSGNSPKSPSAEEGAASGRKGEIVITRVQQEESAIKTQAVTQRNQPETLKLSGTIALDDSRTARVGVRTVGLVMAVYAGLGDYVKKGQILARYHADEVRDTRAQYRKTVEEVHRSGAKVALAQRGVDRAQTLLNLKAGSVQQLEQARQDLVSAQTELKAAEIEVDRTKDVLEDDLRVPAEPKPGDETADQVPILAPISGYIIEKNITPGRTVELSSDTFVIGDLSEVWMLASVRQEQLGQIKEGSAAIVTLPGYANRSFKGRVTNVGQQLDPTTRVMRVRIALQNPGNVLHPQMLATADIPIGEAKQGISIPSDAIQQVDNQDVVFVQNSPEHFSVRPIRAGATSLAETQILDGVKPGEMVVVHGSFVLKSQLLKSTMESE